MFLSSVNQKLDCLIWWFVNFSPLSWPFHCEYILCALVLIWSSNSYHIPHTLCKVFFLVICEKAHVLSFLWFMNVFNVPVHIFWSHCLSPFLKVHKFSFAFWYKTSYACVVPIIFLNENIQILLKFFFSFESGVFYWLWKILHDVLNIALCGYRE